MLAVLRQRNFALVWLAGLISLTGDWFLFVALPLVVYDLTGSTAATAALVAVRSVPRLTIGAVAGVFVDRWDRRRVLFVTNLLLGCCLLPLLLVRSADWLWLLYVVAFVQSSLAPFIGPAESALLPRLVGEDDLVPANALTGLINNLTRLVGPPLGGLIAAVWGLSGAALLDTASFFLAAGLLALVTVDGRALRVDSPAQHGGVGAWAAVWRDWIAGLALVRHARPLADLVVVAVVGGVGNGIMAALFAPFATVILGGGGAAYGALVAAEGLGGLAGNAAIGQLGRRLVPGLLLGLGAIGLGAIDLLTFNAHRLIPGLAPPLILMVIVGFPAAAMKVADTTLVQTTVTDEYRGRVFGSLAALGAFGVLIGAGLAGALGDRLGIVATLSIEGLAFIIAGALALLMLAPAAATRPRPVSAKAES